MKSELQAWVEYFESVLGVQTVLIPDQPNENQAQGPAEGDAFKVIFLSSQALSSDAQQLLEKMIKAMKLSMDQVQVLKPEDMGSAKAQYYVCFSKSIFDNLKTENKIQTFSPDDLLKDSSLKKKSWDDLQIVMRALR